MSLFLGTFSPEPLVVTPPSFFVSEQGRFDETVLRHILSWTFGGPSSFIFVCEQGRFDETALVHSLPWTFVGHTSSIFCVSKEDFDETALVHSLPWTFGGHLSYEQGRFWPDCTFAQSSLSLRWLLILHFCKSMSRKILSLPEPSLFN